MARGNVSAASIKQQVVEQIVDLPVPFVVEEIVTVPKVVAEERFINMSVDQIIDVPIPRTAEEINNVPCGPHYLRVHTNTTSTSTSTSHRCGCR
eukprot:2609175-Amphidinium_carterae.1